MPTGKRAFLQGVAFWGVVLGLCYLGLRYALPCFLPLVLGAVMAAALHPAAAGLCRRLGWRYRPCAVLVAVAALTLLGLILWGIGGVVVRQGSALLPQIPAFYRETLLPLRAPRKYRSLFLIDISVPRNISPDVADIDEVYLYDIDTLTQLADEAKRSREQEVSRCEAIIQDNISKYFPDSALYDQ